MQSVRITETTKDGIEAVGLRLADRIDAIRALVRRRLGPNHAAIFAEPVQTRDAHGKPTITWFTEIEGDVMPLRDLTAPEQDDLRQQLAGFLGELERFADELEPEGAASAEMARALRDALAHPGPDCLWRVGDRPVLVNWGYRPKLSADGPIAPVYLYAAGGAGAEAPKAADRESALPPRSPVASISASEQRLRGGLAGQVLPWVAVVVLLVLLAMRIAPSCGIGGWTWPGFLFGNPPGCILADRSHDPGILEEIGALGAQVRTEELELMGRARACSAASTMTTSAPALASPVATDVQRRLERVERGRSLEITLAWEGPSDLDLHVGCPEGGNISFQSPVGCGARLVADLNNGGGAPDARPIEHIIWDPGPPPDGSYRVGVVLYDRHGDPRPAIPYRVLLWQDGQVIRQESGQLDRTRGSINVLEFTSPSRR